MDGTITKSDVMGHLLPRVGIQWAQKGVPQLLQAPPPPGPRINYINISDEILVGRTSYQVHY